MSVYTEIYEAYNQSLKEELEIDWFEAIESGLAGVYPDTCRLLVELSKLPQVSRILEIGSGLSTLYFAAVSAKYGKTFHSVEESPEWLDKT